LGCPPPSGARCSCTTRLLGYEPHNRVALLLPAWAFREATINRILQATNEFRTQPLSLKNDQVIGTRCSTPILLCSRSEQPPAALDPHLAIAFH
jgi:hypothetical protein